jgi:hypothetical protein
MIKTLTSPILQDKYRWQNKEYKKTKQMDTAGYFAYVQKEINGFIKAMGLQKCKISNDSFILTRREN